MPIKMRSEKYEGVHINIIKTEIPDCVLFIEIESEELRARAAKIREFCKARLGYIHSQGLFRFYTNHGIRHSEKVLRYMDDIVHAASPSMSPLNDYELFLLYISSYCHDLGLLRREGEDFNDSEKCNDVRKTHCDRIIDYLDDNWREMGILNETEALILSNICQAHGSKKDLGMLPEESDSELENTMDSVPVREKLLASILRLADALDADESRLPYEACREDDSIPFASHIEYYKHELVDSVKINPQKGIINVHFKIKYSDPADENGKTIDIEKEVKSALENEFNSVKEVLVKHKIELNRIEFNLARAVSLKSRKTRPAFHDDSPRWRFFKKSHSSNQSMNQKRER